MGRTIPCPRAAPALVKLALVCPGLDERLPLNQGVVLFFEQTNLLIHTSKLDTL